MKKILLSVMALMIMTSTLAMANGRCDENDGDCYRRDSYRCGNYYERNHDDYSHGYCR